MATLLDVLRVVQAVVFSVLGVAATVAWRRRRGAARAWVATTFGVLAAVTVIGLFLPQEPAEPGTATDAAVRFTIALIALFPYLLYRFAGTFRARGRPADVLPLVVTVALVVTIPFLGRLPGPDEPWPTGFAIWAVTLILQWLVLSAIVAAELWRAGRGQPTVSRRRMRLLSSASIGLAVALVMAATAGGGAEPGLGAVATQLLAIAIAPVFLLGFVPPQAVVAVWRRPELEDLQAAEEVLLQAQSPQEVGAKLLPHVRRIIGGEAAVLVDDDGRLLGADGVEGEEVDAVLAQADDPACSITLPVRAGRLVVRVSPYAPYFARSETEVLSRLATFTDLALSRAELSERERQTAVELQAANEAMREFVAIASHDLRTPVTVIKGFASTLAEDWAQVPDAERTQYLAAIRRHADHLSVIIDDLLTTSRLDAGVLEPQPKRIELAAFLTGAVRDFGPDLDATVDVAEGTVVWADEEHLHRMVTNYLANAVRYGAAPITVEAGPSRTEPGMVDVRVCDGGPGVPEEFRPRMFEKFARYDKRHSRDNQGTGLGLAIVRGLAEAAGGTSWYEPNQPTGACFGLRLPVSPPS